MQGPVISRGFEDGWGLFGIEGFQKEQNKKLGSDRWDGTLREVCGFGRGKAKLLSLGFGVDWNNEKGVVLARAWRGASLIKRYRLLSEDMRGG